MGVPNSRTLMLLLLTVNIIVVSAAPSRPAGSKALNRRWFLGNPVSVEDNSPYQVEEQILENQPGSKMRRWWWGWGESEEKHTVEDQSLEDQLVGDSTQHLPLQTAGGHQQVLSVEDVSVEDLLKPSRPGASPGSHTKPLLPPGAHTKPLRPPQAAAGHQLALSVEDVSVEDLLRPSRPGASPGSHTKPLRPPQAAAGHQLALSVEDVSVEDLLRPSRPGSSPGSHTKPLLPPGANTKPFPPQQVNNPVKSMRWFFGSSEDHSDEIERQQRLGSNVQTSGRSPISTSYINNGRHSSEEVYYRGGPNQGGNQGRVGSNVQTPGRSPSFPSFFSNEHHSSEEFYYRGGPNQGGNQGRVPPAKPVYPIVSAHIPEPFNPAKPVHPIVPAQQPEPFNPVTPVQPLATSYAYYGLVV